MFGKFSQCDHRQETGGSIGAGRGWFMPANYADIEKRLWDAPGELCANPKLRVSEYSVPRLGLILLRSADIKFVAPEKEVRGKETQRRQTLPTVFHVRAVSVGQRPTSAHRSSHVRRIRRREINATKPTQLDRQLHLGHC